jgi:alkylresorcinol/alkylpyrone synthase
LLERLHAATTVQARNLALPLPAYASIDSFGTANSHWVDIAVPLGARAVQAALDGAGLCADDVDVVVSTTVTGLAVPSLDARLVPALGLRDDVRRVPLFGLGCLAGAAGIGRVHDLLRGDPDGVAVLVSVELCSLTLQRNDESMANMVGSGLFGDGAAAVVLVGDRRAARMGMAVDGADPRPEVVATRSAFYPDSERVMGWDIDHRGFSLVLDASVPDMVERYLRAGVERFLGEYDLHTKDVEHWIAHPGGPKVLEAMARTLDVEPDAFGLTWASLADVGNLSSSSVLRVLGDTMDHRPMGTGVPAVMTAMGPGFCSELVLLRW